MSKIAIIGHFGGKENITDGQTVKTRILYDELSKDSNCHIKIVDTYYKNSRPVRLFLHVIYTLISTRKIIVLLSGNGMRFFFPLLFSSSRVFHTEVYHDVIGGNLDKYIAENYKFVKYLNSFKRNWVETEDLKKRVETYGVINCEVIPNFKRLKTISNGEVTLQKDPPFRFCTFSRVMKEKGIEDAIDAVESINNEKKEIICTLDVYGLIDPAYKEAFQEKLSVSSNAISYCGVVEFDKSVETIRDYYALLFPTTWRGEGFPGTIVDAFFAGLPVIATDWNSNSEIIKNLQNGIIYPNNKMKSLIDCIKWIILHTEEHHEMKVECMNSAKRYKPDIYIELIKQEMNI